MTLRRKQLGSQAETLAANLLLQKKYQILARNLRTKFGEIDILAQTGRDLVVVEVKAKSSDRFGSAIEMITRAKQEKLILLAHELQMRHQTNRVRIDIITVDDASSEQPKLKHYPGLIEWNG